MKNTLKLKGTYKFTIKDVAGKVRDTFEVENLVTNAGFAEIAALIGAIGSPTEFTYMAVGTDNTAPVVTDTTLGAEIVDSGLERAVGTVSRVTTSVADDTYKVTYTWTATGSKTVEEVGVFNAGAAGDMLSHALTTSKAVTNGETLTGEYTLQVA